MQQRTAAAAAGLVLLGGLAYRFGAARAILVVALGVVLVVPLSFLLWVYYVRDPGVKPLVASLPLPRTVWLLLTGRLDEQSSASCACELTAQLQEDYERSANRRWHEQQTLRAGGYYDVYHGHLPMHLCTVHALLRRRVGCGEFVYLAGDSSLDNKHWFFSPWEAKAKQMERRTSFNAVPVNGYEQVFAEPAWMVKDVSYWLNKAAESRFGTGKVCTMMASIEESTMRDRHGPGGRPRLLAQDAFIREHLTPADSVVISVGGNDIALSPTVRTVVNMLLLTRMPAWLIR
eukprot:SAG31_NODE_2261_length_6065_cov_2.303051_5_plen_289_part_00